MFARAETSCWSLYSDRKNMVTPCKVIIIIIIIIISIIIIIIIIIITCSAAREKQCSPGKWKNQAAQRIESPTF